MAKKNKDYSYQIRQLVIKVTITLLKEVQHLEEKWSEKEDFVISNVFSHIPLCVQITPFLCSRCKHVVIKKNWKDGFKFLYVA